MSIIDRLRKAFSSAPFITASSRGSNGVDIAKPAFSHALGIKSYNSWVYAAATMNAVACASTPLRLYAKSSPAVSKLWKTRQPSKAQRRFLSGDSRCQPSLSAMRKVVEFGDDWVEVTDDHPLLRLFARSNPYLNGFDATVLRIVHGELTGNAYLHPVIDPTLGVPRELWLMPPQWVQIVPDKDLFIKGYKYGASEATQVNFKPDEVIHFKRPHPADLYYGMGKVEAAWASIQANTALHDMDHAMFRNRARPDYVGTVKGNPSDEELDRLEVAIKESLRGTDKTGRFILTSADLTLQPMSFPPKDLTGRDEIVEEIAAIFGVPVSMLKTNDPNLASAQTGFAQWREGTIAPLLRMDEETLNQGLLPLFGIEGDAILAYDDPVRSNEQFELTSRTASVAGGWKTPNEARLEEGLDLIQTPYANELRNPTPPMVSAPLGSAPLAPVPPTQALSYYEAEKKNDPLVSNEKGFSGSACCGSHTKAQGTVLTTEALTAFAETVNGSLKEQVLSVVMEIGRHSEPNTAMLTKISSLLSASKWDAKLAAALAPYLAQTMKLGIESAAATLKDKTKVDILGEGAVSAKVLSEYSAKESARSAANVATDINSSLSDSLMAVLRDGMKSNFSASELAKQVQDWAVTEGDADRGTAARAMTIVRTEVARATTTAEMDAWAASGLVKGKRWLLQDDACEFCLAAAKQFNEGQHQALDQPFYAAGSTLIGVNGGKMEMTNGDVGAPPLHPNCRCAIEAVLTDDYEDIAADIDQQIRTQGVGDRERQIVADWNAARERTP